MSDDIELASGEYVPIQETVCDCEHAYDQHVYGFSCATPGCRCQCFVAAWDTIHLGCDPETAA